MEVTCRHVKDNSTIACAQNSTTDVVISVKRGTLAVYKCMKTDVSANSTMMCGCRGKWRGLQSFNEFAVACGSMPMIIDYSGGFQL